MLRRFWAAKAAEEAKRLRSEPDSVPVEIGPERGPEDGEAVEDAAKPTMQIWSVATLLPKPDLPKPVSHNFVPPNRSLWYPATEESVVRNCVVA